MAARLSACRSAAAGGVTVGVGGGQAQAAVPSPRRPIRGHRKLYRQFNHGLWQVRGRDAERRLWHPRAVDRRRRGQWRLFGRRGARAASSASASASAGSGGGGGNAGAVQVTSAGDIATVFNNSDGILAQSVGGGGERRLQHRRQRLRLVRRYRRRGGGVRRRPRRRCGRRVGRGCDQHRRPSGRRVRTRTPSQRSRSAAAAATAASRSALRPRLALRASASPLAALAAAAAGPAR